MYLNYHFLQKWAIQISYTCSQLYKIQSAKGKLISVCLLGIIDFPKKQPKIWQISALESKKRSNQQSIINYYSE